MKNLDTFLTEASKKDYFDLQSDIYNAIADVMFEYEKHNKDFSKDDVQKALDNFINKFFEED